MDKAKLNMILVSGDRLVEYFRLQNIIVGIMRGAGYRAHCKPSFQ